MKKYKLFLDESGDFDRDLNPQSNKNPSLVGGFLIEEAQFHETSFHGMITGIIGKKNHATELSGEEKGLLAYELLTQAKEQKLEFIIFQNIEKKKAGKQHLDISCIIDGRHYAADQISGHETCGAGGTDCCGRF